MSVTAPSPIVLVQNGAGSPVVPTNGAPVTPGDTVTITLQSTAGVASWTTSPVGQDDLVVVPSITFNAGPPNSFTFTAPAGPWALRMYSLVNNGRDPSGTVQPSYGYTYKIYSPTGAQGQLFTTNETFEGNAQFGWVAPLNGLARALPAGPSGGAFTAITNTASLSAARWQTAPVDTNTHATFTLNFPPTSGNGAAQLGDLIVVPDWGNNIGVSSYVALTGNVYVQNAKTGAIVSDTYDFGGSNDNAGSCHAWQLATNTASGLYWKVVW